MGLTWSQIRSIYPPHPEFTEANLPDLDGKVYIITGSTSGIGLALAHLLYSKHATLYLAARSTPKTLAAISSLRSAHPTSRGTLTPLPLDLSDLSTIKPAAEAFLARASRLDVLFNNAGVAFAPPGSKSAQGHEIHLAVNNLGPFLLTQLLAPLLVATARREPSNAVRVVWTSSIAAELDGYAPGGVPVADLDGAYPRAGMGARELYGISKAGNYLHATEFARRYGGERGEGGGVVSVALHPGTVCTELGRELPMWVRRVVRVTVGYPAVMGAYSELFAGLSGEVGGSRWIIPWGRFGPLRQDLIDASKPESEGGTGVAEKWWEWSERQVKPYM
ncbi:putative short-chain dehydrogenase [Corynespora cassiicola Philippines]|uniref:Putative short-chain dehydrogenase n=1 Tax=Corynespora cassiicola Philippines TaxID=1448308 RepID=A0A2T2NQN0_CORCC|nr:putative short-chain dehydrogenase [Corynespora cassiicola Philippines]